MMMKYLTEKNIGIKTSRGTFFVQLLCDFKFSYVGQ